MDPSPNPRQTGWRGILSSPLQLLGVALVSVVICVGIWLLIGLRLEDDFLEHALERRGSDFPVSETRMGWEYRAVRPWIPGDRGFEWVLEYQGRAVVVDAVLITPLGTFSRPWSGAGGGFRGWARVPGRDSFSVPRSRTLISPEDLALGYVPGQGSDKPSGTPPTWVHVLSASWRAWVRPDRTWYPDLGLRPASEGESPDEAFGVEKLEPFEFVRTPEALLRELKEKGAHDTLWRIFDHGPSWGWVMSRISMGTERWLEVASTLRSESDAHASEELDTALGMALLFSPEGVLRHSAESREEGYTLEDACHSGIDWEETAEEVRAVLSVTDPRLASRRDRCIALLDRSGR